MWKTLVLVAHDGAQREVPVATAHVGAVENSGVLCGSIGDVARIARREGALHRIADGVDRDFDGGGVRGGAGVGD